ncbi:pyridoxamine 5'-phosphate oxidase family protein [Hahella aquimaris]|uniref:pyridoxamine 5'-phosphate oxidase family protein n=1 Tax=Hahella sp. HNIBRBA332 TaxID=3015983 RepID=UPI00273B073A|nr:pyridoxamine 5'-phosphate oxidase family protein [Hahella sp. HNIBRBA332]WLQ11442.1 pyridoxamine 5'-phosphate oxidase family protein [Hahella sp. HNIBRBA332]
MTDDVLPITPKTAFTRKRDRAGYDRRDIYGILDASVLCHVAFMFDGAPFVLPTAYCRYGDNLIVHGAVNGRLFKSLADGREASVCVTLLDGLVLSRRAFHHSMNYRSVVLFGQFEAIEDPDMKNEALNALVDHIIPGRCADDIIPNTRNELAATAVLAMPIVEASAKVRSGPPRDKEEDMDQPVWAGVVPMRTVYGMPEVDPETRSDVRLPDYLRHLATGQ